MLLAITSTLVIIASRLALFLTCLHFVWTFSEFHARLIAVLYLVGMVSESLLRLVIKKGES